MKKIKNISVPIEKGKIRIIFRYYNNGKIVAFEGKLNPEKNIKQIEKILFTLWK